MRHHFLPRLALAGCLLAAPSAFAGATPGDPHWVGADAVRLAASPAVADSAHDLLERTLAGADADALIALIERIRLDTALVPVERDAVLFRYIERLREHPPGSAPQRVLDWLADADPLAVTGHDEGPHHAVPVFNLAGAARGLANEWAWRRGRAVVAGSSPLPLPELARHLGAIPAEGPHLRGMRFAVERLPPATLDRLAVHCAATPGGCGRARADIELARGNAGWLRNWLTTADAAEVTPLLQRARRHLGASDARLLMKAALQHPAPAVAAWAMSDLTTNLPKDEARQREWGSRLLDFLDHRHLGGAAALQLARMDADAWLAAASARSLGERGRRRLELLADMNAELEAEQGRNGAKQ
ncbi:MAG: hypothetical protein GVY11_01030 [Gammaproteobacteria bacterium]|jgi:hypothetical protein|nr:hypothetical protein [Gammaproteobacteria bacterium]